MRIIYSPPTPLCAAERGDIKSKVLHPLCGAERVDQRSDVGVSKLAELKSKNNL